MAIPRRLDRENMATKKLWCLFLVVCVFISSGCAKNRYRRVRDVFLGVVLPLHWREGNRCGRVSSHGTQAMQAISDALEEINSRTDFPPFVLKVIFLDDCNLPSRGASLVMSYFQPGGGDFGHFLKLARCPSGQRPIIATGMRNVVGVISGVHSLENNRLATISGLLGIPVVSYRSSYRKVPLQMITRVVGREPPFLTSSPDFPVDESPPICQLLRRLGSNYVSLVTGEDYASYMISTALQKCFRQNGICIATSLVMKDGSPRDYEQLLDSLLTNPSVKYVIVIDGKGSKNVRGLFAAARRRNLSGRFRWLDGSGWGVDGAFDVTGLQEVISGAITVQPRPIEGFNAFSDRMKENVSSINPELIYAREAVYAYAYALRDMYQELCPDPPASGFCTRMWPSNGTEYQGELLYRKLKGVRFSEGAGQPFYFNSNNEGRKNLLIKQYTEVDGGYSWQEIGTYVDTPDDTQLTIQPIAFQLLQSLPPSVCSLPCQSHQRRVYGGHERCCWICVNN